MNVADPKSLTEPDELSDGVGSRLPESQYLPGT